MFFLPLFPSPGSISLPAGRIPPPRAAIFSAIRHDFHLIFRFLLTGRKKWAMIL